MRAVKGYPEVLLSGCWSAAREQLGRCRRAAGLLGRCWRAWARKVRLKMLERKRPL